MIPEQLRWMIVDINPMALLVQLYRDMILHGHIDLRMVGLTGLYAMGLLLTGQWIFNRLKWKFAEVL